MGQPAAPLPSSTCAGVICFSSLCLCKEGDEEMLTVSQTPTFLDPKSLIFQFFSELRVLVWVEQSIRGKKILMTLPSVNSQAPRGP